jgi:hypothetical protein
LTIVDCQSGDSSGDRAISAMTHLIGALRHGRNRMGQCPNLQSPDESLNRQLAIGNEQARLAQSAREQGRPVDDGSQGAPHL